MRKLLFLIPALMAASAATAAVPVYGDIGNVNGPVSDDYGKYVVANSGIVYAYFLGKNASYTSVISLMVNGVASPESPIFNNTKTALGTKQSLGYVKAGDVLTLQLKLLAPPDVAGTIFSSVSSENGPEFDNHIFRYNNYLGGDFGVPIGDYTYVGFEDIKGYHDANFKNDWDYDDHRFAFDIEAIPEPATWMMMIGGFGLVGFAARRRRTVQVSA